MEPFARVRGRRRAGQKRYLPGLDMTCAIERLLAFDLLHKDHKTFILGFVSLDTHRAGNRQPLFSWFNFLCALILSHKLYKHST